MRQIILDTETTGLDPAQGHRIVEVGAVEIAGRTLTGNTFHTYLNPDRDSDPEALNVHGLDTEFLADKPRFADVAPDLLAFIADAELVIHNAAFDVKFLNAELERARRGSLAEHGCRVTDSLMVAREMRPGKRNSLDALCDAFDITRAHRTLHGALLDARLLAEVWLAMTRGQEALLIDDPQPAEPARVAVAAAPLKKVDASALPIIYANAEEIAAHEEFLNLLDKTSGGACVWRKL